MWHTDFLSDGSRSIEIKMKKKHEKDRFVVYNLRETYSELGEFSFKIVLDGSFFDTSHGSEVSIVDPDRKNMHVGIQYWGRKINCTFSISSDIPDGVAVVNLHLVDRKGKTSEGRFYFWVIK